MLGIGPIHYLAYCSSCLSLSILPCWFLRKGNSGRSPTLCLCRAWTLVMEDVKFWVQRSRQPAASDTPTHPRAVSRCQRLPEKQAFWGSSAPRGVSLAAPKTDFAISCPHLQSPVGFL